MDYLLGPAVTTIGGGAMSGKMSKNLLGGFLSDGINRRMGVGRPLVALEIACCRLTTQCFAQDSTILRFKRTSAIARTCFQSEKTAKGWRGADATAECRNKQC